MALHEVESLLQDYREKRNDKYQNASTGESLPVGTFVSFQHQNPKKGQSGWELGYRIPSSHEGCLCLERHKDGRILQQTRAKRGRSLHLWVMIWMIPYSVESCSSTSPQAQAVMEPVVDGVWNLLSLLWQPLWQVIMADHCPKGCARSFVSA